MPLGSGPGILARSGRPEMLAAGIRLEFDPPKSPLLLLFLFFLAAAISVASARKIKQTTTTFMVI